MHECLFSKRHNINCIVFFMCIIILLLRFMGTKIYSNIHFFPPKLVTYVLNFNFVYMGLGFSLRDHAKVS